MKKVTILIVVFASLVGVGLLGNLITLDIQQFGIFASLSDLEGSKCSCKDANGDYDPTNCQDFMGVYTDTNGICEAIAPAEDYGNPPSENQGCSANFWAANADSVVSVPVWPIGYGPDNYFNQMFQTTIQFSDLAETIEDENADEENSSISETNESSEEDNSVADVEASSEAGETEDVETEAVETEDVDSSEAVENVEASSEAGETEDVETEDVETEAVETEAVETEDVDSSEAVETEDVEMIDEQSGPEEQTTDESPAGSSNVADDKKGIKLVQALQLKEGKLDLLIRESVAAMLNAAHPQIHYPYTVAEIMKMTQIAIASGDYDETMNELKKANGIGNSSLCPSSSSLLSP